ncbi:MAG TPA: SDR family NAD(P)-dependent oxidoreductase [Caulobacteraceae bacterium]|jgi:NAD(P)-dependent dehydrogenase (short-subunit alcohol dehydrogenase family)
MRSVVVTGVSTGIGWGITKVLIGQGYRVFGSVRKSEDADRLRQEFGERYVPLIFDVTDEAAVRAAAAQVREALAGEPLMGLVNNAGVAIAGPLLHLPVAEFRQQIEINLVGVVIVTQAFAPLLSPASDAGGKSGRIVNISSVGGKNGMPFLAPYIASKFALEGLSESLRRELMLLGVDVIVVAPGTVATAIWGKADMADMTPYRDTPFYPALEKIRAFMNGAGGLAPERLGEVVARALTTERPKARYTVAPDAVQTFMMANLPRRMVDRMIAGRLGLTPK